MRTTYVCREVKPGQFKMVQVGGDFKNGRGVSRKSEEEIYGKQVAQDGTRLDTRRRHREYMRQNNLAMYDDFKDTWAKKNKARSEFFETGKLDAATDQRRLESVSRAIDTLRRGK